MKLFASIYFAAGVLLTPISFAIAQSTDDVFNIEELRPGIFRTQYNFHFGVVIEGEDSLLVFDTVNAEFSEWLKNELNERFNKPVKYVVYSHSHSDHVSGGEVFEDSDPIYISHRLTKQSFEHFGTRTRIPDFTFEEALQLDVGGVNVHLQHWGPNNGVGSISLFVPEQKFISVIDWALADRVGFQSMPGYDFEGMINSLRGIDALDWDLIAPGHAGTGTKEDVRLFRRYIETIVTGVRDGFKAKKSEEEIIADTMARLDAEPAFRARLQNYDDWAEDNVRAAFNQIADVEILLFLQ
ncbi:MBL fold metallo-hydrolase [uncultured Roseobacter sp.]|uniref:MBL fold metallo-hydrolase n=1 Tax=uncultured Roseobacter sp. TaxID=114847 RepID=UPI00261689DC|nr:MBL fold metallo-hydrolase [uncultured Roseobacter sp.]